MWRPPGLRWLAMTTFCAALAGCARQDAPPRADTARETTAPAPPTGAPVDPGVSALGSMLVVPGDSAGAGIVIFPDAPTPQMVRSAPLTLLTPGGDTTIAEVSLVMTDSQVCGEAPLVRVQDSLATAWTIGILGSGVAAVRMDSLESLSRPDSSKLAAELARLASSVPMKDDSRFKGLPFSLLRARYFVTEGRRIVASHLVRRVPHEAAPVEEHTLIVAERDTAAASTPFVLSFHLRSEGTEDTAEQFEVLAAVRGPDSIWLLLSRDSMAQTTYQALERARSGVWRSRWSRVLSC